MVYKRNVVSVDGREAAYLASAGLKQKRTRSLSVCQCERERERKRVRGKKQCAK